jgi:hypothetical protein
MSRPSLVVSFSQSSSNPWNATDRDMVV